jgi:hypothetical protein
MWGFRRFSARMQVLVFGVVAAALLGCWGVLEFAPGPAEPGAVEKASAQPMVTATVTATATEQGQQYAVMVHIPMTDNPVEGQAWREITDRRELKLASIIEEIREVVGSTSEQGLLQIAMQAIAYCPAEEQAAEYLIADGVPPAKVKAVMQIACHDGRLGHAIRVGSRRDGPR